MAGSPAICRYKFISILTAGCQNAKKSDYRIRAIKFYCMHFPHFSGVSHDNVINNVAFTVSRKGFSAKGITFGIGTSALAEE